MDMIDDRANPTYFCITWDVLMHETASLVLLNYTTSILSNKQLVHCDYNDNFYFGIILTSCKFNLKWRIKLSQNRIF